MLNLLESPTIWDFLYVVFSLPIEVIIFLTILGVCEFLPVFLCAWALKKHVKVGSVDIPVVSILYGGLVGTVFIFFLILVNAQTITPEQFVMYWEVSGGLWFAFFWFFPMFNAIASKAQKTYIIVIELEKKNGKIKYTYVYEEKGVEYIIQLDGDGHEGVISLLKRILRKRLKFVCEGMVLEFTIDDVHRCIFANSLEIVNQKIIHEDGTKERIREFRVEPVEAHKYNEVRYIANLASFDDMLESLQEEWNKNAKLKRNLQVLARKRAEEMVRALNEAYEPDLNEAWERIKGGLARREGGEGGEDEEDEE